VLWAIGLIGAFYLMTLALGFGAAALLAGAFAASQASAFAVSGRDMGFLFAFGVINLGVGLAFFAMGARLVPAAIAALPSRMRRS